MPFAHRDGGALKFQHAQRNTVDVEHEVRTLGVRPGDGHLLGQGEVVGTGILPVDQPDGLGLLADLRLNLHAVTQEAVKLPVGIVEGRTPTERRGLVHSVQNLGDDRRLVPLSLEPGGNQFPLDVAVADPLVPVPEINVTERVGEEINDTSLGEDFTLADGAHKGAPSGLWIAMPGCTLPVESRFRRGLRGLPGVESLPVLTSRTRPVRSCCIMPCLIAFGSCRDAVPARRSRRIHVGEDGSDGALFI